MPKKKAASISQAVGRGASQRRTDFSGTPSPFQAGSQSTSVGPTLLSAEDARSLAHFVDSSLDIPSVFGASDFLDDWKVQSPEAVIEDVRQRVQEKKPWMKEIDESMLETRRLSERQSRMDRGYHIILPDNRVRSMEGKLSRRIRAELLGEELPPESASSTTHPGQQATHARRADDARKKPAHISNPWYLPPQTWFSDQAAKNDTGDRGVGFPYDDQILKAEGRYQRALANGEIGPVKVDDEEIRPLTQREKETLQSVSWYRAHMKGPPAMRLPLFLQ
eukprot:TRINITY_DN67961_c0_g1_i1.p1 TRINITY_DN67961_c0_g1~~TRINITY_DN67961_c0_g1_i1.p1  ORF type:complete len:289 (-),score=56.67 TRINITY_DN67961_c0_g1_i1:38-871(-)